MAGASKTSDHALPASGPAHKAVVRSDVVDRSPRAAGITVEQIAGAGKSGREFGALAGITAPETSRAVAKTVIPFSKSRRMVT